ncbi:glycosyltransferase, partial [Acinetobacter baumannii]
GLIAQRKEMIQRADRVIAISESTRKDLLELFSIPADKICTIYHGNSLQADINPLGNRKKYILYVGSRSGIHKNFTAFLN